MGQVLIKGLLKEKAIKPQNIIVSDFNKDRLGVVGRLGVTIARGNPEVVAKSDIIIFAVKPKDMGKLLEEINGSLQDLPSFASGKSPKLVISIAAGITTGYIKEHLGRGVSVIRAMPNTPVLIGEGMTAIAYGETVHEEEGKVAEEVFKGVGETVKVAEELMEAVTALSGSGPAYVFAIMESLVEAGVKEGLSPELAQKLVSHTVLGAASMAIKTGEDFSTLIEAVTSPGGTTEAALKVFKEKGLEVVLVEGVRAAAKRARELKRENIGEEDAKTQKKNKQ